MIAWKPNSMKKDYVGSKMYILNMIVQKHLEREKRKLLKKRRKGSIKRQMNKFSLKKTEFIIFQKNVSLNTNKNRRKWKNNSNMISKNGFHKMKSKPKKSKGFLRRKSARSKFAKGTRKLKQLLINQVMRHILHRSSS